MTAQISDTVLYKGQKYSMIGLSAFKLFSPAAYGMNPVMMSTACYHGYYATYELTDEGLFIRDLTIRSENGKYPPLDGVEPVVGKGHAEYEGLGIKIEYTGSMRIAREFIRSLYVHMGFQDATSFEVVLDLRLQDGKIVEVNDRSLEMRKKRGAFKERYEKEADGRKAVREAFSRAMEKFF